MRRPRWLLAERRAVAAVEFAIVAPVLITVLLSVYDVTAAITDWWQVCAAAGAIARIATAQAAQPDGTNVLTTTQAADASTAIYALMPALEGASPGRFGVAIAGVAMTPTVAGCTANCTYLANVAWSLALQGSAIKRGCGQLGQVPDGQKPSSATLPADAFTSAPLIVVDVTYQFVPLFNTLFGSGLSLMESAYLATRTGTDADWVRLTGALAAGAKCPGWSG